MIFFSKKSLKIYDDIFYLWFSPYVDLLPEGVKSNIAPSLFYQKLVYVLRLFIKDVHRIFLSDKLPEKENVWLFVSTINNYKSIEFLKEKVPDTVFVKPQLLYNEPLPFIENRIVYRRKIYFFFKAFLVLPFYKKYSSKKVFVKKYWPYFFYGFGMYEESLRVLKKSKPKAIIFSNDHSVEQRALLCAARELNIKTIYLQHASVSEYFPPLEFSLSLLEGEDALNKYKQIAPINGQVKLIGMPKFDQFLTHRVKIKKLKKIGICFNPNDQIEDVKSVADYLDDYLEEEIKIMIRPHPADQRYLSVFNQELSDSKKEPVFGFLSRVDSIIAGDSSIHLEAAMLNRYPIYYNFSENKFKDYYGYVKQGLSKKAANKNELLNILLNIKDNPPDIYKKAKYYNAKIDSPSEGNVKKEVINEVNKLLTYEK